MKVSYYFHESPIKICTEKKSWNNEDFEIQNKIKYFYKSQSSTKACNRSVYSTPFETFLINFCESD